MSRPVTDDDIRAELAEVCRNRARRRATAEPWWDRRYEYLVAAGRREQIDAEGLDEIRRRARLALKRRSA